MDICPTKQPWNVMTIYSTASAVYTKVSKGSDKRYVSAATWMSRMQTGHPTSGSSSIKNAGLQELFRGSEARQAHVTRLPVLCWLLFGVILGGDSSHIINVPDADILYLFYQSSQGFQGQQVLEVS